MISRATCGFIGCDKKAMLNRPANDWVHVKYGVRKIVANFILSFKTLPAIRR